MVFEADWSMPTVLETLCVTRTAGSPVPGEFRVTKPSAPAPRRPGNPRGRHVCRPYREHATYWVGAAYMPPPRGSDVA